MTAITPPPPPPPQPVTPTPQPQTTVIVQNPPPSLSQLPVGAMLDAALTSNLGKDLFQLQTPLGKITVQTALPLAKTATLVLQLQNLTPQMQFQISTVDGKPAAQWIKASFQAGTGAAGKSLPLDQTGMTGQANAGISAAGLKTTTLTKGVVMGASLLRPLHMPKTDTQGAPAITRPGTPNSPTKGTLQANASTAGKVTATGTKPVPAAPQAPQTNAKPEIQGQSPIRAQSAFNTSSLTGAASVKAGQTLPAGTQFSVKIANIRQPSPIATNTANPNPSSLSAGLAAGRTLLGTVTGTTASGLPIVETNSGVLSLSTQSTVPRGSVLTLEIVRAPSLAGSQQQGISAQDGTTLFSSRKWPALEEVIQTVHEAQPSATTHLINSAIPRLDAQLTASLIFFLSALRGGDVRAWIGDQAMRILEREKPGLLKKITDDFGKMVKVSDEPVGGDWRVALVPLSTGEQLEQIRMLMRQHDDSQDDENDGSGTRFIIDVELSRLGRLQLDGLARDGGKKLDLIIRSEAPLPDKMTNDIRDIFQEVAELTGLTGSVNFQSTPANFIETPDPLHEEHIGLMV